MLYVLRLIVFIGLLSPFAMASESDLTRSVKSIMTRVEKEGANITVPANKHQDEGIKTALEVTRKFYSPEFQEKLKCEQKRIKKKVFSAFTTEQEESPTSDKLGNEENIYLFFSSSMPDETVHAYLEGMETVDEPKIVMLMKGFMLGERESYLVRIAKKDIHCVDQLQAKKTIVCDRFEIPIKIKPSLFAKYNITQVPALVYERGNNSWKIGGDMALDYLLEKINSEAQSPGLKRLVKVLRGNET